MKYKECLDIAEDEINEEHQTAAVRLLKERAREIKAAKITLKKLKASFDELLDMDVDEHVFDE